MITSHGLQTKIKSLYNVGKIKNCLTANEDKYKEKNCNYAQIVFLSQF
jgi:hypothetical protein